MALCGAFLAAASLLSATSAHAQAYTWGGTTTDYNAATNWSSPPAGAPPVAAGQSAIFDATGSTGVTVTSGPIAPNSWTFNANSQAFVISGAPVNFGLAGAGGGVIDNANSGQSIEILNNIGGSGVRVRLLGNSELTLLGTNTYSGGTFICPCGSLQLGDATHTASIIGAVTNEGLFNLFNANTTGITSISNNGGEVAFSNATSAGTATITNNGGEVGFLDTSSAGSANITNRFGITVFGALGGVDTGTAGNATITNNDGGTIFLAFTNAGTAHITNVNGGGIELFDQASAASANIVNNANGFTSFGEPYGTDTPTAGHATITNNSSGETLFNAFSSAGNATIITNSGGATYFYDNSTGGNAQFITNGTGFVDFSGSIGPNGDGSITAGSIAGSGSYYVGGGNTLIVGGNNLSTTVTGVIADNNPCGCTSGSGSLEKVGTGTLTLSGINTYTGTTTVLGGVLDVEGSIASSSLTTVNAGGALSGAGFVGNTMIAAAAFSARQRPARLFDDGRRQSRVPVGRAVSGDAQSHGLDLCQSDGHRDAGRHRRRGVPARQRRDEAIHDPDRDRRRQRRLCRRSAWQSGRRTCCHAQLRSDPCLSQFRAWLRRNAGPQHQPANVGTALTNFFNANGGIPLAVRTLTRAGLTQVSGELATGSQQATFDAMNLFLGSDRSVRRRPRRVGGSSGATPFAEGGGASAYAAKQANTARCLCQISRPRRLSRATI